MDSILKTLSIGLLLRSLFSGIFFVLSFYLSAHDLKELGNIDASPVLLSVALIALFSGVVAYGFHRSLVYPLIEHFLNSAAGKKARVRIPLISISTIETLLLRWDYSMTKDKPVMASINGRLDDWAHYTHFQYTATVCIVCGAVAGVVVFPGKHPPSWPLISLAIALFISAFVSNWRQHVLIDHVKKKTA